MEQLYNEKALCDLLFAEAQRINNKGFIAGDPVQFPRRYTNLADIEISALLVSTISWGNRKMIIRNADRMLGMMDSSPYAWCMDEAYEAIDDRMNIHRTFFGANLKHYMRGLRRIYSRYPTLEAFARVIDAGNSEAPSYRLAEALNHELSEANGGQSDTR